VAPACAGCGLIGGGHAPGCAGEGTPVLSLVARLDEITGVGVPNAQVLIAELGTDASVFPTPGHAAAWARLTSRTDQSGTRDRPGRTGRGNPYLRAALGQCVMAAARTDTRLGGRLGLAREHLGQRGLARAVPADQPDPVAGRDLEARLVQQQARARAQLDIFRRDHLSCHSGQLGQNGPRGAPTAAHRGTVPAGWRLASSSATSAGVLIGHLPARHVRSGGRWQVCDHGRK
jgi:hypothetical protein